MTDDVVIGGGGWIGVATGDQLDRALRVEHFRDVLRAAADQLGPVIDLIPTTELQRASAPAQAFAVRRELAWAIPQLRQAADRLELVGRLTRAAMLLYGEAENVQNLAMHRLGDQVGYLAGLAFPWVLSGIMPAVGGAEVAGKADGGSVGGLVAELQQWITDHPGLLNNEHVADAIELIAGAVDDVGLGMLWVPPDMAALIGDGGLGLSGVDTAAAGIVAGGGLLGLFNESAVSLKQTYTGKLLQAPSTYAERIRRLPDTARNGGAQIRIDKYFDATGRLVGCDVYLSGTQEWDVRGTGTPFDMTSNMRGIANRPNGSVAAVETALAAAGIDKHTPVAITGHSQGGIVAHEVAATGRYNVVGLLEAGTPAVHTKLEQGTPEVDLVHDEDLVPSLGGGRDGHDTIVVSGTAYRDGEEPPPDDPVSAHDSDRYRKTAAELDTVTDPRVENAKRAMNSTSAGATEMTTTYYKAERATAAR